MDERVVFGHSVEALLRTLDESTRARLTPELTKLGFGAGKALQTAYSLDTYIALLDLFAQSLFAGMERDAAFVEVGRTFMRGYSNTMMGRALMALMRVAGPRRALERITRNFRTANSFSEVFSERVSESCYRVRCSYVLRPGFYQGIIGTGLEIAGAQGVTVALESAEPDHRVVYLAAWT